MKIAIHDRPGSFSDHWISYCQSKEINYKLVNCYTNDIIKQLEDCDALMWHFHHANPKDVKFAKQLIYSVHAMGKRVFPDFNTVWHFDDKVGQKYLFEAIGAPLVPTYVFYSKQKALTWTKETTWPKVFKLRGGAGSQNVRLAKTRRQGIKLIKKAFGKGSKQYNAWRSMKERWRKFLIGKAGIKELLKGIVRFFFPPEFSIIGGKEIGYVYFQDFIPELDKDYRTKVVANNCWGYQRLVRKNDFRASGSGSEDYVYSKNAIPEKIIIYSLELAKKFKMQTVAFDFLLDKNETLFLVEISCFYGVDEKEFIGYWDKNLNWHEGTFDPYGWMVELVKSE